MSVCASHPCNRRSSSFLDVVPAYIALAVWLLRSIYIWPAAHCCSEPPHHRRIFQMEHRDDFPASTCQRRDACADSGDCERSFRLIVNAQEAWRRWGGSFTSSVHDPSTSDGSFGAIRP